MKTIANSNSIISDISNALNPRFKDITGKLSESGIQQNGQSFTMERTLVSHKDIEYVVYRFDPNEDNLFPYFSNESGLKKICDYIIFAVDIDKLYILLIELKYGTEPALAQVNASEVFSQYIMNSIKRINANFQANPTYRKIRISEYRSKKKNGNQS